jgi:hypothetical protein
MGMPIGVGTLVEVGTVVAVGGTGVSDGLVVSVAGKGDGAVPCEGLQATASNVRRINGAILVKLFMATLPIRRMEWACVTNRMQLHSLHAFSISGQFDPFWGGYSKLFLLYRRRTENKMKHEAVNKARVIVGFFVLLVLIGLYVPDYGLWLALIWLAVVLWQWRKQNS